MADLTDIYNSRKDNGQTRQPRHAGALDKLNSILLAAPADQPYRFDGDKTERSVIGEFRNLKAYTDGSAGYVGKITGSDVIYRLSGLTKVAKSPGVIWRSHIKADAPDPDLYRLIEEDYKRIRDWVALGRYCTGYVCNDRNFSWWTTFPIDPLAVNESAHLLGLTNNSLHPYSIVLRCPVASLTRYNSIRVPTAIDAYRSPVFHTTRDSDKPKSGITVKLSKPGPLSEGVDEFVLKSVEVDKIDIMPVFISDRLNPYFDSDVDPDLWTLLYDYYKKF